MKINRQVLPVGKEIPFEEKFDFSSAKFDPTFLRKISYCKVYGKTLQFEETLRIVVDIDAKVVAVSAYSLKDVPLSLKIHDELIFSDDQNDDSAIYEPDNIFLLDPYILSLIVSSVPTRVTLKGEQIPESGKGYRVISESDYLKEREKKTDTRWQKLDSVKIDDD